MIYAHAAGSNSAMTISGKQSKNVRYGTMNCGSHGSMKACYGGAHTLQHHRTGMLGGNSNVLVCSYEDQLKLHDSETSTADKGVQNEHATDMIRTTAVRWPVVVGGVITLIRFVPYVVDLFTAARLDEGYGLPMTGIIVGLTIAAIATYCSLKQRRHEARWLLIIAACVLVLSFTGPRIAAIAITLFSSGIIIRELVRKPFEDL